MINCPDRLAPSNEELLSIAYDEGTLTTEEQAHIDRCTVCQQRLATYVEMNETLLARLKRSQCPGGARLSYYCLDMVPEEERTHIASHLLDCPACAEEVAATRRLQASFDPFPETAPLLGSTVRRIFATLVAQQARPVLVTRSASQATGWPRQYRAGLLDLSLHLSRQASGETMLLGILTSSDPTQTIEDLEGLAVELYTAPGPLNAPEPGEVEPLLTGQIDDLGNLLLEPVPAGEYTLIIRLPDKEVVIEDLKIEHG
jgi:hypothetical protein